MNGRHLKSPLSPNPFLPHFYSDMVSLGIYKQTNLYILNSFKQFSTNAEV